MNYIRCAALLVISQLVWTGNTDAAIVKDGFKSSFLARWSLSASGPWASVALPYADSLVRAFADDWTAVEGEHWFTVNVGDAQSIHAILSPTLAAVQNECHTVNVFDGAAYGFEKFGKDVDIRLHFASAELVETVCAESAIRYAWLDDGVGLEHDVHPMTCTPFKVSGWDNTEVVGATPLWTGNHLFAHHDHAISEPNALTLRLLAWLVVLMTVSAQSYNGWPNYATWYVFVWANACASEYWQDRVASICESENTKSPLVRNERIRSRLVRELIEWVEEKNPLQDHASLYGDLLREVIGEVDWMRIADNWLTELEESHRRRPLTEPALRA